MPQEGGLIVGYGVICPNKRRRLDIMAKTRQYYVAKYTKHDIASAINRSTRTVTRAINAGDLNPDDIISLVWYIYRGRYETEEPSM